MQKIITHHAIGEVTLSRTRRSTRITLSVRPGCAVRLSFPVWVTQKRALRFLDEKVEWIANARKKMAERYPNLAPDGWYSGPDAAGTGIGTAGAAGKAGSRTGTGPESATEAATGRAAEKRAIEALRAEAKALLPPMVARLAAEHGFRYGAVRVKMTRSRWGSCTARNDINLSLSLASLPEHLAEYIVLHELCHTVHKNHSDRFHSLLDSVTDGRSKALNKELRSYRPGYFASNIVTGPNSPDTDSGASFI